MAQLRESRKEEIRLQSFLKEADAKAEKLNMEIFELCRRIGSKSSSAERPLPPPEKDRQEIPKLGTPKRDFPKKKNARRTLQSLSHCKTVMNV